MSSISTSGNTTKQQHSKRKPKATKGQENKLKQLKLTAFFKKDKQNNNCVSRKDIGKQCNQDIDCEPETKKPIEITIDDDNDDEDIDEITVIENSSPKKPKYSPADFVEFESFNYNEKVDEKRKTPFYKKIPYTRIVVDAFNFPKEPEIQHYFLSHFHADHYVGLCKSFDRPIYCSPITARLIRFKFKTQGKYIHAHELNEPFRVESAVCTFYEANHCPGAVIILFELDSGMRYFHTGDFRACPEMERIPNLRPIDCCFLDTTFCDRTKDFPPQQKVIDDAVDICRFAMQQNPRTLIVCGSYCIGKEKVFMSVAEALNIKVWCDKSKRAYFNCIQDKRLNDMLVDKQEDAKLHVLPLKKLWKRGVRDYLENHCEHFDSLIALRPSGWEWKRNKHMVPEVEGNIAIYPVPYSEHSSYKDLERFIKWLRPRRIIPTVNTGDPIKRGQMNIIFRQWQQSTFVKTKGGDPNTSAKLENSDSSLDSAKGVDKCTI